MKHNYRSEDVVKRGGKNTVLVNGKYRHITDLDKRTLCEVWAKRQKELDELYQINARANQGWPGFILNLIGIHLPDRNRIMLGGIDSKDQKLYEPN